jgi:hypothetical protein
MHYSYEFTVLTTHTVTSPLTYAMKLGAGILKKVDIDFPAGCDGAVRCVMVSKANQVLPTNPDGFYAGDGKTISAQLHHSIDEEGTYLAFVAWSTTALYPHTLRAQLEVQGPDEPDINQFIPMLLDTINRLIALLKGLI